MRWIEQLKTAWSLVFVPVSIRAETNQALTFYQAFAARLAEILGEPLPEPRADPAAYYRDKVIDYLDRIGKGSQSCLVVIDGLDEARGWKMDTTVLPLEPNSRLKFVVSARELAGDNGPNNWLERLGWTPPTSGARTLRVVPLTREGIADVLAKMEFPIGPLSTDIDIINELYRLTDKGDPLVLHFYVNDLLKKGDEAARLKPTDLRKIEPGFGAYIKRWLDEQRTEWKLAGSPIDEDLVDAILAVLASAFGPLKLSELEELVARVLPGNRIFSVRTIEPLRRFIVGDGKENGYALAHPKLADFLHRDYFAGSKILRDCQDAFVTWMREVVLSLNEGRRPPEDTPAYALLFYTQHLSAMFSNAALELYRELAENGWRKAWEHHEGGFQGFSRDIELAARAFRAAAEKNSDQLRMPRTGLGAQVRCALCLSSIRSIGLGVTGEVLAEFLRSRTITPKQALYLVQLKEDKDRAKTIGAIIELLPADLRLEAYASATDIVNPEVRFKVLFVIAPHLSGIDRDRAFLAALRASKLLKNHHDRLSALSQLEPFLPDAMWAEASAAEKARGESEEHGAHSIEDLAPSPQGSPESVSTASADRIATTIDGYDLEQEASRADLSQDRIREILQLEQEASRVDLSQDRIREILQTVRGWDNYGARRIIGKLAPRLSRELQVVALDGIPRGERALYRGEMLAALVPFLAFDLLDMVFRLATIYCTFDLEQPIKAVASRLDANGLQKALQYVFNMESEYHRAEALRAIAPHLMPDLLARALQWSLKLEGYYRPKSMSVLLPLLPVQEALDVMRNEKGAALADVLMAVAPNMPRDFLPQAVKLAAQITDIEERGRALAKLLPLLRDAELSIAIIDAYLVAFVIGDRSFRALAQAALVPYLDQERARRCVDELPAELSRMPQGRDDLAAFVRIMALALTSALLPDTEAAKTLDQAVATARDVSEPTLRALALGVLAARLSVEHGAKLMKEAVDLARTNSGEEDPTLALLAAFCPPEEIQLALEDASREAELSSDADGKKVLIRIVSALMTRRTATEMQTEVAEALNTTDDKPMDDKLMKEERCMTALLVLVFSPKLSTGETDGLIREALALQDIEEPEARAFLLALVAPYLPTPHLGACFRELLDIGARLPRPVFLTGLALAQGLVNEFFKRSPAVGGNRISGSPLARLGGPTCVSETVEAINDVCSWWL